MARSPRRPPRRVVPILLTSVLLVAGGIGSAPAGAAGEIRVRRDLAYGTHPQQVMDVYLPAPEDATGAGVVIVHGGGWRIGDKRDYTAEAQSMAAAGLAAFNIDYRLENDTDHPWPDEFTDVQHAVRFVAERAPVFGLEPGRLALLGGSAGGQLAALVGTLGTDGDPVADPSATTPTGTRVRAVVTWSGIFDLTTLAPRNGAEPPDCAGDPQCLTVLDPELLSDYLGCSLAACPETYAAASPIDHVGPETAPMLVVNAREETVPLAQPQAMLDRLAGAGVDADQLFLAGNRHSRAYADDALAPTILYLRGALGVGTTSDSTGVALPVVVAVLLIAALALFAWTERRRSRERIASGRDLSEELLP